MTVRKLTHELLAKGWTKSAIAVECGVRWNTVDRWANGVVPYHEDLVAAKLKGLLARKRIPKGKVPRGRRI